MEADYDLIIVGCGPAGLSAGLYAARSRLKTLLLGDVSAGGEMRSIELIENYPGFPDGVTGAKLGLNMMKQAMKYDLQFKLSKVDGIEVTGDYKQIKATLIKAGDAEEETYLTKTVIIAGGAHPRKLGVPGENEFAGKGVYYCGVCDAPQFADQVAAVVGGGDTGLTEGLYLTRIASEIHIIELMPQLNASRILQERAFDNPKIKVHCGTKIEAITGDDRVNELDLVNVSTSQKTDLSVGAVLIRIGLTPNTGYLKGLLSLDSEGYVLVNDELETSVPGIYAAGDIRYGSARQIATAVGDGVTAALSAERLLNLKY
jgi:thioredoxin reductase (NADPH)